MRAISMGLVGLLFFSGTARAVDDGCPNTGAMIKNGLLNGTDCAMMTDTQMNAYASGFINGILMAPMFNAPAACMARTIACLEDGKTNVQFGLVIRKFIRDHPERLHEPCNFLSYSALLTMCPR